MTTAKPTARQKQIKEAVEKHGSRRAAAAALGVSRGTINKHMERLMDQGIRVKPNQPKLPLEPVSLKIKKETVTICAIGDFHDCPGQDKSRIKWIARYIADTNPDLVVQIGDFADWNSLSRHEKPGTIGYADKPAFVDDLDSAEEVLSQFRKILKDGPPCHITYGNHEDRLERWDNEQPESKGLSFADRRDVLFKNYGWKSYAYGQWLFINGVGFTHVPHNLMGREYGGKTVNTIANDAVFSIVFGHSHRKAEISAPKIGPAKSVEILNLGTAMPQGLVKYYAGKSMTGWAYGVWSLSIRDGHIVGHSYTSMADLESRYGD